MIDSIQSSHPGRRKPRFLFSIVALLCIFATLAAGSATTYTYDAAGRLTAVNYGNGIIITYTYDRAGNLLGRLVSSRCDVNQTGTTNVADIQTVINQALGASPPVNDLNGDSVVNVVDVQIVVSAALGLGCSTH
jgi:YD repeat-containing protein